MDYIIPLHNAEQRISLLASHQGLINVLESVPSNIFNIGDIISRLDALIAADKTVDKKIKHALIYTSNMEEELTYLETLIEEYDYLLKDHILLPAWSSVDKILIYSLIRPSIEKDRSIIINAGIKILNTYDIKSPPITFYEDYVLIEKDLKRDSTLVSVLLLLDILGLTKEEDIEVEEISSKTKLLSNFISSISILNGGSNEDVDLDFMKKIIKLYYLKMGIEKK